MEKYNRSSQSDLLPNLQHSYLAPLTELLDDEIEQGDGVANLELFGDETDQLATVVVVVGRVPVVQVSLQVVTQTLVVQCLVHQRRGVFDQHVDEVQQLNCQEFCTQKYHNRFIGI